MVDSTTPRRWENHLAAIGAASDPHRYLQYRLRIGTTPLIHDLVPRRHAAAESTI
jgi:hypothetical protein